MPDNPPDKQTKEDKRSKKIAGSKTLLCYKCGEYVAPQDEACPQCGAKGGLNAATYVRIVLGCLLGLLLWLIFWR
jgi:uncharacterized OB-fold protein